MDEDLHNPVKKKIKGSSDKGNYGSDHYPLATVVIPVDCEVLKVLIKDGMYVEEGQSMFVLKSPAPSSFIPLQISSEGEKLKYKKILEGYSRVGIFPMKDVLVDQNAAENSTSMQWFDNEEDVMQRYENFKKFDTVVDHSDHFFSSENSGMKPPGWTKMIKEEWMILEEQLPGTIFVRVYESRMNLLRAVIIGPEGTPYHDGLFFFDVCFPDNYPHSPPLVRYRSGGLGINPNLYKSGEVCLKLFNTATQKEENLWVPGTSNILQLLLSIQGLILNTKPYFYEDVNATMSGYVYAYGDWFSLLYNENTIIKSLKTMINTMNKPPKNFEDLVVGHFRNRVRDILMACKRYTEGLQVGCLVSGYNNETCSIEFKNDVVSCINPLVDAFNKVGAKEAQEFLHLIEKSKVVDVAENKKRKLEDIDICHGSAHNWLPWNLIACSPRPVTKVLVKEGMKVAKGQPLCSYDVTKILYTKEVYPISLIPKRPNEATIKKQLYAMQRSRVGIFSMEDLSVDQDDVDNSSRRHDDAENSSSRRRRRKAGLVNADVLKRYVNFKKFDCVVDHSDHFFSAQSSAMNQPGKDDWAIKIREEWRILEEHLPETIFARGYELRMDLLRAVIIGPEGTPYHRVIFFFDVCFPTDYPNSPPLMHYRSGGLAINPNFDKFGEVCLNTYRRKLWVPGTTTMLQLLVSIQNQFFVKKPLFSSPTYSMMRGSFYGKHSSKLYNENTMIKSLKTIVYTINKLPKNFEDFVAGHYHYHRRHILMAFCEKKDKPFSKTYVNDTASMIKPLKGAIAKIKGKQKSKSKTKSKSKSKSKTKSTIPNTKLKNKN